MDFKRIYIEITNICNLKCPFCSPMNRVKQFMTAENFEKIINQVGKYHPQIYLHVKGEPLMHPQLEKMISIAEEKGILINITTNGTLIAEKGDILLSHRNVRQVNISVHSLKAQCHDEDGYLESISKFGIKALKEGRPYISYRMWNGGKNEEILPEARKQLEAISQHFGITLEDRELLHGRNSAKLGENIYISFEEEFQWPSLNLPFASLKGTCQGGKNMLAILVDGTVVPCCLDADGIINLGNIFTDGLDAIVEGERFKNLRQGFMGGNISEELCQKCSYRLRFDKKQRAAASNTEAATASPQHAARLICQVKLYHAPHEDTASSNTVKLVQFADTEPLLREAVTNVTLDPTRGEVNLSSEVVPRALRRYSVKRYSKACAMRELF